MDGVIFVAGLFVSGLLLFALFRVGKRKRSGPHNNWRNEAFVAREEGGSWVENDCAVGRNDAAPPSIIPGVR